MNTYTIFRAMEKAKEIRDWASENYDVFPKTFMKSHKQYMKFRDEVVRSCERYDLAKMQIKDLKEERDQLLYERIKE